MRIKLDENLSKEAAEIFNEPGTIQNRCSAKGWPVFLIEKLFPSSRSEQGKGNQKCGIDQG